MPIRPAVPDDFESIHKILLATEVFNKEEIDIALELLQIYFNDAHQKDYEIFASIDDQNTVRGYICIGPTPATMGTYDLYWIAVDPSVHSKGIGSGLLRFIEEHLRNRGGRLLIAETSSTPKYDGTREFYRAKGFALVAQIRQYYKPDDDLIIYGKYL